MEATLSASQLGDALAIIVRIEPGAKCFSQLSFFRRREAAGTTVSKGRAAARLVPRSGPVCPWVAGNGEAIMPACGLSRVRRCGRGSVQRSVRQSKNDAGRLNRLTAYVEAVSTECRHSVGHSTRALKVLLADAAFMPMFHSSPLGTIDEMPVSCWRQSRKR